MLRSTGSLEVTREFRVVVCARVYAYDQEMFVSYNKSFTPGTLVCTVGLNLHFWGTNISIEYSVPEN